MSSSPNSSSSSESLAELAPLYDVPCEVSVVLGTGRVSVRQCLYLKPKTVIPLDAGGRLRHATCWSTASRSPRRGRHPRRQHRRPVDADRPAAEQRGAGVTEIARRLGGAGAGGRRGLAAAPRRVWRRSGSGSDRRRDRGHARRAAIARHRRRRGPAAAARPDALDDVARDRAATTVRASIEGGAAHEQRRPAIDRRRGAVGAAADRPAADADLVPARDSRDDDVVHAHRHRLSLPAAGARHAGDAVEPDPHRPGAVPDHVHHGAGRRADQRAARSRRRWTARSR